MSLQVFVPITDEMIYDPSSKLEGSLVPYSADMAGQWLSIEINPVDTPKPATKSSFSQSNKLGRQRKVNLHLAYSQ